MSQSNSRCGWSKFSESRLIEVENKILSIVKSAYRTWFVPIESPVGKDDKIWTILVNEDSKNTPLVLLHGFAAGLGFWCLNFDHLAQDRPVYAIDLLGFGRSSRPDFSNDSLEAEQQWVKSLEEWRKKLNLDKFILLGHSFGGYLATSYAINHPDRVKHLILVDPWGFTEKPAKIEAPFWLKCLGVVLYPLTYLNPLATVRGAGPLGPWLVNKVRSDISEKYGASVERKEIITEYIYQCNSQKPSGEAAFHNMRHSFAWAKDPMIRRFHTLRKDIPITILYGEKSWLRKLPENTVQERKENSEYFNIEVIPDAGHHINADQPTIFNQVVSEICKSCDDPLIGNKIKPFEISQDALDDPVVKKNLLNFQEDIEEGDLKPDLDSMQISNKRD